MREKSGMSHFLIHFHPWLPNLPNYEKSTLTALRKVIRFLLLFGFCRMPNSADIFTAENILKNSDKFKSQKI